MSAFNLYLTATGNLSNSPAGEIIECKIKPFNIASLRTCINARFVESNCISWRRRRLSILHRVEIILPAIGGSALRCCCSHFFILARPFFKFLRSARPHLESQTISPLSGKVFKVKFNTHDKSLCVFVYIGRVGYAGGCFNFLSLFRRYGG